MPDSPEIAISAFLDGEPVAAAAVLEALDTNEGRAALVDFVRLRVLAAESGAAPSADFYARIRNTAPVIRSRAKSSRLWIAAAAVAASLAVGFWTGVTIDSNRPADSTPPKAVRVVEFQPGVDWHQAPPVENAR